MIDFKKRLKKNKPETEFAGAIHIPEETLNALGNKLKDCIDQDAFESMKHGSHEEKVFIDVPDFMRRGED